MTFKLKIFLALRISFYSITDRLHEAITIIATHISLGNKMMESLM